LIFLHGWTCDSSSFDAQLQHFSRTRRVIIPNLRGHGPSDAPAQGYDLGSFVDDLRWQLDELDIERAIVVGHSMGGNVGLELAVHEEHRISGVLMIDSVVLPSPEVRTGLKNIAAILETSGPAAALEQLSPLLFVDGDDRGVAAGIMNVMAATPAHVAIAAFRAHIMEYDAAPALAGCRARLGYIAAANPLADVSRMRALCPNLALAQTLGSGHFSTIYVPDQINAMIERFMALVETPVATV
jgi:pimeloyl-ACP methyl ester carboxylesterase